MVLPFRALIIIFALLTGIVTSYTVFAETVYDTLDGHGPSRKRVDVIEWDGNLEVHVYPKGAAAGLGAKLDDRTQGKKVMVIGYRFKDQKETLVRRAILGIPFDAKVKGFIDSSEPDFDKLAISNQNLPAPWKVYRLDPAPKQWYPDGDERNQDDPANTATAPVLGEAPTKAPSGRAPASATDGSLNNYKW